MLYKVDVTLFASMDEILKLTNLMKATEQYFSLCCNMSQQEKPWSVTIQIKVLE